MWISCPSFPFKCWIIERVSVKLGQWPMTKAGNNESTYVIKFATVLGCKAHFHFHRFLLHKRSWVFVFNEEKKRYNHSLCFSRRFVHFWHDCCEFLHVCTSVTQRRKRRACSNFWFPLKSFQFFSHTSTTNKNSAHCDNCMVTRT